LFTSSWKELQERRPRRCVPAAARNAQSGLKFGDNEPIAHLEVSTARTYGRKDEFEKQQLRNGVAQARLRPYV